ncbi:hypothetical protein T31B1_11489 [Salinisphaera sp. T31B1]
MVDDLVVLDALAVPAVLERLRVDAVLRLAVVVLVPALARLAVPFDPPEARLAAVDRALVDTDLLLPLVVRVVDAGVLPSLPSTLL